MTEGSTKTRILEAAWRLLRTERGAAAMAAIAQEAGVSRQAVYLHFGDRASLLLATVAYINQKAGFEDAIDPVRGAPDGATALDLFAEFLGEFVPKIIDVTLAIEALAGADPDARAMLDDRLQHRRQGCIYMAERLERECLLPEGLSLSDAIEILMGLSSHRLWVALRRDAGCTNERYVAHVKRMLRQTLLAREGCEPACR